MASIFTKIVQGVVPSHRIAENEHFYAFLDIQPIAIGHTLVIPKQEIDYIFDLDDTTLGDLHVFSKKVARAIEKAIPCKRIGVIVYGLEVPHAHIHLIPINTPVDMDIKTKVAQTPTQLAETAELIRKFVEL